ncbi:hypothetical protein HJFPF1_09351 [Paramyrothecium foliicola]|nr:hypothetical protein HJFPF1_09351 [Paramyrothecium foliicola]
MPPRVSHRRGSRAPSREPDAASPAPNLQRPHLPELQGTPSSRRQYSYGAGVEPLPARPGRNLGRGQVMDLGSALRDALIRQDEEETQVEQEVAQQSSRRRDLEEDELAGASMPPPPRRSGDSDAPPAPTSFPELDLPDDTRSFATESSIYGDATIMSSPGPAAAPSNNLASLSSGITAKAPFLAPPSAAGPQPRSRDQPLLSAGTGVRGTSPTRNIPALLPGANGEQQEAGRNRTLAPSQSINTPAVRRNPARGTSRILEEPGENEAFPRETRRPRKPLFSIDNDVESRAELGDRENVADNRSKGVHDKSRPRTTRSARENSRKSRENGGLFPTDASEQDAAMQKEIEEAEAEAAREERARAKGERKRAQEQRAREQREKVAQERREKWEQRWTWLKSQPPLSFFQATPPRENYDESETGVDDDDTDHHLMDDESVNMWQLLNPLTYVRAIVWLFEGIFGTFFSRLLANVNHFIHHPWTVDTQRFLQTLKTIAPNFLLAVAIAGILPYFFWSFHQVFPDFDTDSLSRSRSIDWSHLTGAIGSIGNYIPVISWPSTSWPSSSRWDDLPELGNLDDLERGQLQNLLNKYERELQRMHKTENLHEASLKKLEKVVPKIVHMDKRGGKLVIEQEFWHALRDLLVEDGSFLSLNRKGSSFEVASERQWQAIATRLVNDPTFATKLNSNVKRAEDNVEKKWANSWESWVKSNDAKIAKILGPQLDKILTSKTDKQMLARVEKLLKESESGERPSGSVVTRAEFLRHLQSEFSAHRAEIRAQLQEHQPQLEQLIRETVDMAAGKVPRGMTRAEITELVDGLVRKSIADMNLAAMAKGQIRGHWDEELKNQVNFFGIGAGATIDPSLSSVTYTYVTKKTQKPAAIADTLRKGLLAVTPPPHIAALLPWFDEGDCWCGAHSRDSSQGRQGASLSVQLGHYITPRTVVVEHILSGATTDPGAAPRQMEIWAYIADPTIREATRSFSHTHFARYDNDNNNGGIAPRLAPFHERFVRIGRFAYDGAEQQDGVYVHQLSPELVALGVETDQVIVRALTNLGDLDHTCFYRVRLYGRKVTMDEMLK